MQTSRWPSSYKKRKSNSYGTHRTLREDVAVEAVLLLVVVVAAVAPPPPAQDQAHPPDHNHDRHKETSPPHNEPTLAEKSALSPLREIKTPTESRFSRPRPTQAAPIPPPKTKTRPAPQCTPRL